eukprot:1688030-Pleurochrysis_carterae.AAC.1
MWSYYDAMYLPIYGAGNPCPMEQELIIMDFFNNNSYGTVRYTHPPFKRTVTVRRARCSRRTPGGTPPHPSRERQSTTAI